jgi:hypothetical protein
MTHLSNPPRNSLGDRAGPRPRPAYLTLILGSKSPAPSTLNSATGPNVTVPKKGDIVVCHAYGKKRIGWVTKVDSEWVTLSYVTTAEGMAARVWRRKPRRFTVRVRLSSIERRGHEGFYVKGVRRW